ncbi:uncharacterized protein B0H18DRAFT_1115069 [Fomitopsis serialis]|uniref:uncharacterized protein n=1 Tax=Fomitopsis serialis TaxID=139415 RepID=UPI0020080DE7|nr:uncharacterized protein B0H18DRAFT_1115069 [Neoantrodia serialis]KAH9934358.1 hypothetical protein B0H18DRAFT_1115069 [Neoantrodia serialis]
MGIPVLGPTASDVWAGASEKDHGDLSTRGTDVLPHIISSVSRRPSIYTMSREDRREFIEEVSEACFDCAARARLADLKVWFLTGDVTCPFPITAFWAVQDDDRERGGGFVDYKMLLGINHFMHWDDPEKAVQVYLEALA